MSFQCPTCLSQDKNVRGWQNFKVCDDPWHAPTLHQVPPAYQQIQHSLAPELEANFVSKSCGSTTGLTKPSETPAPLHPFEVRISIGGEDWDYVVRTLDELARHIADHGPECNSISGGAGGSHSVSVSRRDISPEQYRAELAKWHEEYMAARAGLSEAPPHKD